MNESALNKHSIAWFKLAECVSRKEKERALGMHRLLSHSIDDTGYSRQLEGDILLSFNESDKAIERYLEAIELYTRSNRLTQAVAVYEHLIVLSPSDKKNRQALIDLYKQLGLAKKAYHHQTYIDGH